MRVFLQISYFVVGIAQFFAVWDGIEYFLGVESFIGKGFAFFVSIFVTYIPLVGSLLGVYGATNVWGWSLAKSLFLFFWYIPVVIIVFVYEVFADRR